MKVYVPFMSYDYEGNGEPLGVFASLAEAQACVDEAGVSLPHGPWKGDDESGYERPQGFSDRRVIMFNLEVPK